MSRSYENAQNNYRPHGAAEWRKYRAELADRSERRWQDMLVSQGYDRKLNTEEDADKINAYLSEEETQCADAELWEQEGTGNDDDLYAWAQGR